MVVQSLTGGVGFHVGGCHDFQKRLVAVQSPLNFKNSIFYFTFPLILHFLFYPYSISPIPSTPTQFTKFSFLKILISSHKLQFSRFLLPLNFLNSHYFQVLLIPSISTYFSKFYFPHNFKFPLSFSVRCMFSIILFTSVTRLLIQSRITDTCS